MSLTKPIKKNRENADAFASVAFILLHPFRCNQDTLETSENNKMAVSLAPIWGKNCRTRLKMKILLDHANPKYHANSQIIISQLIFGLHEKNSQIGRSLGQVFKIEKKIP